MIFILLSEMAVCQYKRRFSTRNSTSPSGEEHIKAFDGAEKKYTNYCPNRCMFDSEINIHDTYIANIKYKNGVLLNYSANFSGAYEGYHLAINGTHGRLESAELIGAAFQNDLPKLENNGCQYIDYFPIFEGRERIYVVRNKGGHGGGDPLLLEDIFLGVDPNRSYKILASVEDGLRAISIGDAIYNSIMDGEIKDLSGFIK